MIGVRHYSEAQRLFLLPYAPYRALVPRCLTNISNVS
jgi:hypothetical protein